jgi:S-phase kinase-associated protein 1
MATSTETTTTKNMVRLTSSDGEWFDVRAEAIGAASVTIGGMLEDGWCSGDTIPVPNVTGRILARVLEYVNRHFDDGRYDPLEYAPDSPLKRFDREFINVGDDDVLFDIILVCSSIYRSPLVHLDHRERSPLFIDRVFDLQAANYLRTSWTWRARRWPK